MTTSNVKLLPLPEDYDQNPAGNAEIQDYARANVEHHTTAKDAEIEALRAEVQFLRSHRPIARKLAESEARAEQMAEALRAEVARLEEANRQMHAHGEVLYARVVAIVEAGKALPSPRFAQVITFEGADYVLVRPDDFDALHAALHPHRRAGDGAGLADPVTYHLQRL